MPRYNPAEIEPKWQAFWHEQKTFQTPRLPQGEKLYVLDMFPYPSGDGLHVGHPEGYTATDVVCRFERMRGKSVMHPMGFDSFGLPAEEHAIRTNTPPRVSTEKNIANFTRQLKSLGFSYDWDRVLATTDVKYFRWTQWIFLQLYDTWYDTERRQGRPISELPIPADVAAQGENAVREYQDDHRLAYQADALVNWCPKLGTVLANEEVQDGVSERGGHPVERIPLRQWMLRITAYADRLLTDLEDLNWSTGIKKLQTEWIGRSTGAEVDFFIGPNEQFESWKSQQKEAGFTRKPSDDVLRVYTTRPDTLFGATYMVIAPEHPFVERLTSDTQRPAVEDYCRQAASKSDRERTEDNKAKTGVFSGSYAINPVNGEQIPIWIADYVLISYGTGAIMAVPAHDTRDFEFAVEYDLPIIAVLDPGDDSSVDREAVLAGKQMFVGDAVAIHSGDYDGTPTVQFKQQIITDLSSAGLGREAVNYKLRDWLFSRQRFWGEPFPILHELGDDGVPTGMKVAVSPEDLPVDLPHLEDYKPHGRAEPPLAKAGDDWLYVEKDGKQYKRETNTMPQWAGSCWYYLRYIDVDNEDFLIDPELEKAWMPVDLYVGGAEHAVLHLLYARFWHKVLYDRGHVSHPEPFQRLINQGMILGEMEFVGYQNAAGEMVSKNGVRKLRQPGGATWQTKAGEEVTPVPIDAELVEKKGDSFVLIADNSIQLSSQAEKMSKSRGNVVNPDHIVEEYGADSLRLYEMFMGPLEASLPWSMNGVNGVRNFLDRSWRMIVDAASETMAPNPALTDDAPTEEQDRVLHRTVQAVSHDVEHIQFNTAIARMMEFVNFFTKQATRPKLAMEKFVLMLSPFAPHLCEELWRVLGHTETLAYESWPTFDEALTKDAAVEIPVQISGKVRARIQVASDANKDDIEQQAREDDKVAELISGKNIVKVVVVPGRMVNFVIKG